MAIDEKDYIDVGKKVFDCMTKLKEELGDIFKGFNVKDGVIYIDIPRDTDENTKLAIKNRIIEFTLR